MPDTLMELLSRSFDVVSSAQALIIGALCAVAMARYGSVIYFALIAIVVDQFVTVAFKSRFSKTVEEAFEQIWREITELDADVVVLRFLGFMLVITVAYGVKSLFVKPK